jgi:hypothetical protein
MTNNMYRQGTVQELKNDYVIIANRTRGINREGSASKIQDFMRICLKYHPVNIADLNQSSILQDDIDIQELIPNIGDGGDITAVFWKH